MNFKLFYVGEANGMSAEEIKIAEEFIAARDHAVIGTSCKEKGARVSGFSHLPGQSLQEFYFATESNSQKVKNISENPLCELMYTDGNGQVILTGNAEVLTDAGTKKSKWMDHMIHHFPEGPEGDLFCIVRFKPVGVRAMLM